MAAFKEDLITMTLELLKKAVFIDLGGVGLIIDMEKVRRHVYLG